MRLIILAVAILVNIICVVSESDLKQLKWYNKFMYVISLSLIMAYGIIDLLNLPK